MVTFGLSERVAERLLRPSRRFFGKLLDLFLFFFFFLAALELLGFLLPLCLFLPLDLLDLLDFLCEQDLDDKDLGFVGELLRLDAEALACLLRGVLVRALAEALKGAVTGMTPATASSSPDDGGPGG